MASVLPPGLKSEAGELGACRVGGAMCPLGVPRTASVSSPCASPALKPRRAASPRGRAVLPGATPGSACAVCHLSPPTPRPCWSPRPALTAAPPGTKACPRWPVTGSPETFTAVGQGQCQSRDRSVAEQNPASHTHVHTHTHQCMHVHRLHTLPCTLRQRDTHVRTAPAHTQVHTCSHVNMHAQVCTHTRGSATHRWRRWASPFADLGWAVVGSGYSVALLGCSSEEMAGAQGSSPSAGQRAARPGRAPPVTGPQGATAGAGPGLGPTCCPRSSRSLALAVRGVQGFPRPPSPRGCGWEGPSGIARLDLGLWGWTLRAG